jgi:hypothetical protein
MKKFYLSIRIWIAELQLRRIKSRLAKERDQFPIAAMVYDARKFYPE